MWVIPLLFVFSSEPEAIFARLPSLLELSFAVRFVPSGHKMGDGLLHLDDRLWVVFDISWPHVSTCRNPACLSYICRRIKRLVMHSSGCRLGANGACLDCRLLLKMCHLENHGNCIGNSCGSHRCRQLQRLLEAERARMRRQCSSLKQRGQS